MQKGGEGVQKACKNAYVINGRPPTAGCVFYDLCRKYGGSVCYINTGRFNKGELGNIR